MRPFPRHLGRVRSIQIAVAGHPCLDELHERPRERFIHSVRKVCQRRGRWTIKGSQCANAETLTGNADNMDLYLSQAYMLQISWAIPCGPRTIFRGWLDSRTATKHSPVYPSRVKSFLKKNARISFQDGNEEEIRPGQCLQGPADIAVKIPA